MSDFENQDSKNGFSMKLWRGECMCLLGFDVADPEPDFVGFAIECRRPGATDFYPAAESDRILLSYLRRERGERLSEFPLDGGAFSKVSLDAFPILSPARHVYLPGNENAHASRQEARSWHRN